jgi:hypothetical protein
MAIAGNIKPILIIAIFVALLVLIVAALFFWGSPRSRPTELLHRSPKVVTATATGAGASIAVWHHRVEV